MGAILYLCGPTMHVAKTMWSFLDNFFLLSLHGSLKTNLILGALGALGTMIFVWTCRIG